MTQEDDYKSPWKEKDETIVNNTLDDTGFRVLNSFQDDTSEFECGRNLLDQLDVTY